MRFLRNQRDGTVNRLFGIICLFLRSTDDLDVIKLVEIIRRWLEVLEARAILRDISDNETSAGLNCIESHSLQGKPS